MDPVPVLPLAAVFPAGGSTRSGSMRLDNVAQSADETKYDGRHSRERFAMLNRWIIGMLLLLGAIIFMGDGLMIRNRIRGRERGSGGKLRTIPGEVVREQGVYDDNDDSSYYPDEEINGGGNSSGESAYFPGGEVEPEPDHQPPSAVDPKLAELAEKLESEARENILEDEKHSSKAKDEDAPLNPVARPTPEVGLNSMRDPDPSWALASDAQSCDGYFGNGFTEVSAIVGSTQFAPVAGSAAAPGAASASQLGCWSHPTTHAYMCRGTNLILHPARITVTKGGEDLDAVMGRSEDSELPEFQRGALEVYLGDVALLGERKGLPLTPAVEGEPGTAALALPDSLSQMEPSDPYKARMLKKAVIVDPTVAGAGARHCSTLITDAVMFVTRVEYANLFHTSTDWFNTWQAARLAGLSPTMDYEEDSLAGLTVESRRLESTNPRRRSPRIPLHVVFLDGHNAGPMDDGWLGLFLSFNYVKHFDGPTCFTNVIMAPYGYHAAISQGLTTMGRSCKGEPHVRQFGYDFVRGLGLAPRAVSTCGQEPANILFVRRVHYLAHPRHNGKIVRRLDNEDEIVTALEASAASVGGIKLLNGLFSGMTLLEQVQSIQDACVVVGAHGAGLSHVLFAPDGEHMLELQPPGFQRPHFIAYAFWATAAHHNWVLQSSTPEVSSVIARIREVVSTAGSGQAPSGVSEMRAGV